MNDGRKEANGLWKYDYIVALAEKIRQRGLEMEMKIHHTHLEHESAPGCSDKDGYVHFDSSVLTLGVWQKPYSQWTEAECWLTRQVHQKPIHHQAPATNGYAAEGWKMLMDGHMTER